MREKSRPEGSRAEKALADGGAPDFRGAVPESSGAFGTHDFLCITLLVLLTASAWCLATGKGLSSRWDMPTTYIDPTYSDFLGNCAFQKTLCAGSAIPYAWKSISDLAAPDGVDWNSAVSVDDAVHALLGVLTCTFGIFAGFNLGLLLSHIATALTFYLVARRWLLAVPIWAFVGALAFGLAPYLFAQSPHHVNIQFVWHLPLFPVVWTWVATGCGLQWGSRRFRQALAIGFLTGLFSPYFTLIFCQLTLLGNAALAWRRRSWKALVPAIGILGAVALAVALGNVDTVVYRLTHPPTESQTLVANREYRWMDIYGFKIVDLFIPSFTHHSETLAKFGITHRQASVLNDEEGCAYLGLLGIACLFLLVAATARALLDAKPAAVPIQAWWVLWIVLCFNTGGLNATFAAFTGFTLFRTAIRYSVVVLVIVLLYGVQRLTAWQRDAARRTSADVLRIGTLTAATAACILVLWDQVPRGPAAEYTAMIAKVVDSDRAFVAKLETSLADKAMVFQLPVMDGTPLPGVPGSDHYRPYLFSTYLRWSHGAIPGSKNLQWQQDLQKQLLEGATLDQDGQRIRFKVDNVRGAIDALRKKGFTAIYVNRNGFPDRGKGLFDALLELGYATPPIYSPAGDLACVILGDQPIR